MTLQNQKFRGKKLILNLISLLTRSLLVQAVKVGSPNGSIHRTFRAVFEMPVAPFNHNLIKIGKRQYRNPICLAQEWQKALDDNKYASPSDLSRHFKVSRARVTQVLNLLKLASETMHIIASLGDPLSKPIVTERVLRAFVKLGVEQQKVQLKAIILK